MLCSARKLHVDQTYSTPSPDINDDELFTSGLSKMVVGLARWPHIRKGFYFCYILKAKQIQYCYIYKHESLLSFETVQLIQKGMQNLKIKMSALCFSEWFGLYFKILARQMVCQLASLFIKRIKSFFLTHTISFYSVDLGQLMSTWVLST